ncbi:MAG: hypothetical protein V1822_04625 [Candidatus Micrarchaeota archaeon]
MEQKYKERAPIKRACRTSRKGGIAKALLFAPNAGQKTIPARKNAANAVIFSLLAYQKKAWEK